MCVCLFFFTFFCCWRKLSRWRKNKTCHAFLVWDNQKSSHLFGAQSADLSVVLGALADFITHFIGFIFFFLLVVAGIVAFCSNGIQVSILLARGEKKTQHLILKCSTSKIANKMLIKRAQKNTILHTFLSCILLKKCLLSKVSALFPSPPPPISLPSSSLQCT